MCPQLIKFRQPVFIKNKFSYWAYWRPPIKNPSTLISNAPLFQFIGLRDKNKKDIYTGDIIQFGSCKSWASGNGERAIIHWDGGNARFGLFFYSIYGGEGSLGKHQNIQEYLKGKKIIGNIIENPQLAYQISESQTANFLGILMKFPFERESRSPNFSSSRSLKIKKKHC
jgi:hypothetical protein